MTSGDPSFDGGGASITVEVAHPHLSIDESALRRLLLRVAQEEGVTIADLTVVLSDHAHVLDLNRTYLEHDYETDVLAFNLADDPAAGPIEGEIYIDLDTAQERHSEFNATFQNEVFRYAIHGLLHLAGYDDSTPERKAQMRALEDRYLSLS